MFAGLKNLILALFNKAILDQLYEKRRALNPSDENRTKLTVGLSAALFAGVFLFLITMAWVRQDISNYIDSHPNIRIMSDLRQDWQFSEPTIIACNKPSQCLEEGKRSPIINAHLDHFNSDILAPFHSDERVQIYARKDISADSWAGLEAVDRFTAIVLPAFKYETAHVFLDGALNTSYFQSQTIAPTFDSRARKNQPIKLEVVFSINPQTKAFLDLDVEHYHAIDRNLTLMPQNEYRKYQTYLTNAKTGRGDFVGAIARIVMAVFVLLLFLIIDGSPETLGLGLFLGFEGFAKSTQFGWLPIENTDFIMHFCFQMGDIFRLYFFLQLARLIDKNINGWLIVGTCLSVPYGLLRHYGDQQDMIWLANIPAARDIAVGMIGAVVCFRTCIYLRNKELPWRVIALLIAGVASFEQAIHPVSIFIPSLAHIPGFTTIVDVLQPTSAWLLAFSAFINISTLENRVKILSNVAAHAKVMENEMELAKTVQQAFFTLPTLPKDVNLVCHHEAMLYVSGDTYFADWDETHQKLTFLINDVTGHGVQAALKASGVSVIANTLWRESSQMSGKPGKIKKYATLVQRFFAQMNEHPDIVAMGGGEFDLKSGQVTLYRQNFPFPILISPKPEGYEDAECRWDDKWMVKLLSIPNDENTTISLTPGAFVVFTSDGFLDTSRKAHDFLRYLRKHLGREDERLSVETVKSLILNCNTFKQDTVPDDRTLTVFQWDVDSQSGGITQNFAA